jgi:uncharacterized protein YbbC (DUF1343 family)
MVFRRQICIKKTAFFLFFLPLLSPFHLTALSPTPAAFFVSDYLPALKDKKIGLVVNHTSRIGNVHLVDTLLRLGCKVKKIFAPEHGFRGDHSAGAHVNSSVDAKTGLPIFSLYGENKKPSADHLDGLDLILFDIQDVGVRFYTYISTMHYMMEACALYQIPFIVLDRPNPNGHYVDGPLLKSNFKSFVGLHPIPVVHGLTVGELAMMIVGEKWIENASSLKLTVYKAKNYSHASYYELPIAPSPNLKNQLSILLYPSLCFFEGTIVSVGRGTDKPFQVFGFPNGNPWNMEFTPKPMPGADNPPHKFQLCRGVDLSMLSPMDVYNRKKLNIDYLLLVYDAYIHKDKLFSSFFDKLAGTDQLRKQIIAGWSAAEIRNSWSDDLKNYQKLREKYLLYPL